MCVGRACPHLQPRHSRPRSSLRQSRVAQHSSRASLSSPGAPLRCTWGTWRGVTLQQPQELHREPWRWHKVVGVVLEVSGGGGHDLRRMERTVLGGGKESLSAGGCRAVGLRGDPVGAHG